MVLIIIFIFLIIRYSLSEEWTIHVYTGKERFAGTDSNIFIRLFNSKSGNTDEYELTHENWIIGNDFPLKNLFEHGGHDRFRIVTEKFGIVEKIHVRQDGFPLVQSDWLLDRIVVERNRDSTKFTFKCNCWLRRERPHIILPVLSDQYSSAKNNLSKKDLTIVIILIVSIVLFTCIICCIRVYCCHHQHRGFSPISIQQQSSNIDRYYLQLPEPSAPRLLNDTSNQWENIRYTLPYYSNTTVVTGQSAMIISTDEPPPPAYADLFPD